MAEKGSAGADGLALALALLGVAAGGGRGEGLGTLGAGVAPPVLLMLPLDDAVSLAAAAMTVLVWRLQRCAAARCEGTALLLAGRGATRQGCRGVCAGGEASALLLLNQAFAHEEAEFASVLAQSPLPPLLLLDVAKLL